MKLLAIDTSQLQATVCLLDNDKVIRFKCGSTSVAHSESLLQLIDEVLLDVKIGDLDGFAVGIGPGSFTGIRIGMATIKAFAQITNKKIIPFSSLYALACSQNNPENRKIVVLPNAYQGLIFAGYENNENEWIEEAITIKHLFDRIESLQLKRSFIFTGSGVVTFESEILELNTHYKYDIQFGREMNINQNGICRLLCQGLSKGNSSFLDIHEIKANYIRPSQAEIKLQSVLAKE